TVPPGTTENLVKKTIEKTSGKTCGKHFQLCFNPEFLREGNAIYDTLNPDYIAIGEHDKKSGDTLEQLYKKFHNKHTPPIIRTNLPTAELIKYANNAFLATKISFINTFANICEKIPSADVTKIAEAIGKDHRINPHFLNAGLGWGGSCFPKDTAALLAMGDEHGYSMPIVVAAREVNLRQRYRVMEKLQEALKGVRGRVVGVLGLAFKPGTGDVRESPALDVVRLLVERQAHVRVHDPVALENARRALEGFEVEFFQDPYDLAAGAEALLLATDWPDYRHLDLARLARLMRTPVLVDGRNLFEPKEARRAGWTYLGVGR
ncbi:MAG: nucleotide sugar dehydrogenase, partial [Firmicutes bacterium]|nr:nucleotide sugar dehydrogenase [Bacillota bacterium]